MTAQLQSAPPAESVRVGIASILLAVFCFAIVDAIAKWLGHSYDAAQIVFLRYFIGLAPVALLVWRSGGIATLRTRRPFGHALRAGLIFVALLAFFSGLKRMPLAEAIAIAFTAPLFIAALSGPMLGERVGPRRWAAVWVGFVGALVMIRPGTEAFRPDALYIVAAALAFAFAMMVTRRLVKTESNVTMLAYTTAGAALCSLPLVPFVWQTPAGGDVWLFVLVGLVGSLAAYFVISAYRHAPAAVVAPFEYTALIWGAIFGWLIWREQPEAVVWIGAAVVVGASLYVGHREARIGRPAEPSATR